MDCHLPRVAFGDFPKILTGVFGHKMKAQGIGEQGGNGAHSTHSEGDIIDEIAILNINMQGRILREGAQLLCQEKLIG